jgi:hypothetical protein
VNLVDAAAVFVAGRLADNALIPVAHGIPR